MKKIFAILSSANSGISQTTTALLVLILPYISLAQIKIEERVEIKPQGYQYVSDDPTSSHTIRIEMQWTPASTPGAVLGYYLPCQSANFSGFVSGGNLTYQLANVSSGGHAFQFRFNIPCNNPQPVNGQYQLYFDDVLDQSGSFNVGGCYTGSSFPFYDLYYAPPLESNFYFSVVNDESCLFISSDMSISTYYDCTSGNSWNRNTQPVNLVFTSGGEFASFYNENEQLIGDSFSGILSDFQTVSISQDSIYSGTPDKYLIVQCEWGGIIKTDSLKLLTQTGTEIVADTYGMDSLYSGQEIMIFINVNDLSGQCPVYLPPEANYNIQIIEGSQYGNLIDPITGNRVKNIAELDHYYGFAYLNYTADGLSADSVQRVVVRIGTTYPGIPNTDFTLYIKPSPIFAYTVPEVLGADDTADVIIKHRLEDGTLEDFPPEQTFELTVLDGCVNGNFMLGDSINVYFADALQPIKFVTADIIDPEFDKVLIRVGTDIDGGGGGAGRPVGGENEEEIVITEQRSGIDTLRAGFEKMIAEKKAEVEAKKNKTGGEPPIEAPIVTQCALDQSNKEFNWQGLASIGRGCKEYSCNEQIQIEPPLISLDKYKTIDYPNLLLCDPISNAFTGGYFRPLFDNVLDEIKDELLVHFEVFTCFDENDDLWKFKVNNGIGFKFRVIEDLCYSNLQGLILIKNANIDLFNKIPDEKVCQALKDFEDQRRYYRGGISDGAFIIESALLNHEEVHEWTFIHHINKTLNDKFYNATYGEIMTFKESLTLAKECNDLFSNFENSRSRAKTEYENVMQEFINKLKDRYNRHKENKFKLSGVEYSVSEILAQWNPHVQLEINVYQSNLEMFRGEGDCKYRIEKVFEESIYEKILDQIGNN